MVQRDVDPLTGAARGHILMSSEDAARLGVQEGQRIRLRSSTGAYTGVARINEIKPGNLEVYWPEANMLLSSEDIDRDSQRARLQRGCHCGTDLKPRSWNVQPRTECSKRRQQPHDLKAQRAIRDLPESLRSH